MSLAANPYAAPAAKVEDVSANPEAEAIRKAHLNHEASVKAVGALYYLSSVLLVISGIASLAESVAITVILVAAGIGIFFVARGVRALRPWARITGSVLAAIGLLGFPVGTLINLYILYLFLSKKGRTVFSPEYQDVIAATPDIKYRTSILVWIFLGLIVLLIGAAVVVPLLK